MEREGSFLIGHIKLLSGRVLNRMFIEKGIREFNSEQGKILYSLWKDDCISSSMLSNRTGLALNSLTKMLELMEQKGLVTKKSCSDDKRKKLVSITEKGKIIQEKSAKINNEFENVFYDGFSEEDIRSFEESLKRILDNLKRWEEIDERNNIRTVGK